jgi:hypothetical protein
MFAIVGLLERLAVVARRARLVQNTIDVYCLWVRQFLRFAAQRYGTWKPPQQLGTADVEAFLNDLVIRRRLSASSQNQALCALGLPLPAGLGRRYPAGPLGEVSFAARAAAPARADRAVGR